MGEITRFEGVDAFEERVRGFLLDREAEHCLMIGICGWLRTGEFEDPYLAAVTDGDRIVAAALRTPPHQVILSHVDDQDAIDVLVRDLWETSPDLSGVLGAPEDAGIFVRRWRELSGRGARLEMQQRIHAADHAVPPDGVPGAFRQADPRDTDLLVDWFRAFNEEALMTPAGEDDVVERTIRRIASGALYVWEAHGAPASFAGVQGETPNGIRVGPVYTPPDKRRRGYATALVAAITQAQLDLGRRFCALYTDLANPTSNSIYRKVGYEPVCDVDQYVFG